MRTRRRTETAPAPWALLSFLLRYPDPAIAAARPELAGEVAALPPGPVRASLERFLAGWTGDAATKPATSILSTLDFGDGRSALYDFTDNQWHNPLRTNRITVRGSHGEIANDTVTR